MRLTLTPLRICLLTSMLESSQMVMFSTAQGTFKIRKLGTGTSCKGQLANKIVQTVFCKGFELLYSVRDSNYGILLGIRLSHITNEHHLVQVFCQNYRLIEICCANLKKYTSSIKSPSLPLHPCSFL